MKSKLLLFFYHYYQIKTGMLDHLWRERKKIFIKSKEITEKQKICNIIANHYITYYNKDSKQQNKASEPPNEASDSL